jgi:uncharacterized protein (TIGR03663 family)
MQNTFKRESSFLDAPLTALFNLNFEVLLWVAIIVFTVVTRFWDLGSRSYNHDESLHTLYSWYLYEGRGYKHDPMMHGPFQFHFNALIYFLFGDNDYTGRILPAIFGVLGVSLPLCLRRWLGRVGALVCAGMIAMAPDIFYYSRFARNDIYHLVWSLLAIIGLFGFVSTKQGRYLVIGAVAISLMWATKEVVYIFGFSGFTFIVLTLLVEMLTKRKWGVTAAIVSIDRTSLGVAIASALAIFVVLYTTFFTNPDGLRTGAIGAITYWLAQQEVARGGQPWYYYFLLVPLYNFMPCLPAMLALGYYAFRRNAPTLSFAIATAVLLTATYLLSDAESRDSSSSLIIILGLLAWATISLTLSALYGRGDQPLFTAFVIHWLVTSFAIYSWAGEKMPWLSLHMTLPIIILAAKFLNDTWARVAWASVRARGGLWFGLLLLPIAYTLWKVANTRWFDGSLALQKIDDLMQGVMAIFVGGVLIYLAYLISRRLRAGELAQVAFVVLLIVLSAFTVRYAFMGAYEHGDVAVEMLIYAQGAPDVPVVVRDIEALSQKLTGGKDMDIIVESSETWPFAWYLRDYKKVAYPASLEGPPTAPVVLVAVENEAKYKLWLTNYIGQKRKLIWWSAEDYKNLTWERIRNTFTDPKLRESFFNYLFYRKSDYPLGQWPLRKEFVFYVRKDVASLIWTPAQLPPPIVENQTEKELAEKLINVTAKQAIGKNGKEDGAFNAPKNLAFAPDGAMWVVDSGNHRLQKFDATGKFVMALGGDGNLPGQFKEPWGMAIGSDGTFYVVDTWNHRIQKFDASGKFLMQWGQFGDLNAPGTDKQTTFYGPRSIAIDAQGNLWVVDTGNKRVLKFDANGKALGIFGGSGTAPGQFAEPVGIAISKATGDIYVADTWNKRVQRFNKDFQPSAQWSVHGWDSTSVVNKPYLALDANDNVYLTDPEVQRVLKYTKEGKLIALFGKSGSDLTSLNLPTGIAVDAPGNVWVADSFNHRVLRFEAVQGK